MPGTNRVRAAWGTRRAIATIALSMGFLAILPRAASAQRYQDYRTLQPRQVLSINPIGVAAGLYSAEYEMAVDRQMSVGATASHVDFGDDEFTTFDARWRLYLNRVLHGVAFGLSAGIGRTLDEDDVDAGGKAHWGLTVGSTLDYQWILGDEGRFALGTGVGFKRFVSRKDGDGNGPRVWPTLRLSVGAAF
jgi:hypothetical protein